MIRSPHAIRPWQHVLEPLSGYLTLAEHLWEEPKVYGESWNFGPDDEDARPVQWIVERLAQRWGNGARWQLDERTQPHEATYLKLDCSKAKAKLGWHPRWDLTTALDRIVEWYQAFECHQEMRDFTVQQINDYTRTQD